jgi:hypothetical protein
MRALVLVATLLGTIGCGGGGSPGGVTATKDMALPTTACAKPWSGSNDPHSVCKVDCSSNAASSDVTVHIVQTAVGSAAFVAHVQQTRPAAADLTFAAVSASWSGHFFNFADTTSQLPLKFHLLTRGGGANDLDNVEVYTNDSDLTGGPVNVGALICTVGGN